MLTAISAVLVAILCVLVLIAVGFFVFVRRRTRFREASLMLREKSAARVKNQPVDVKLRNLHQGLSTASSPGSGYETGQHNRNRSRSSHNAWWDSVTYCSRFTLREFVALGHAIEQSGHRIGRGRLRDNKCFRHHNFVILSAFITGFLSLSCCFP